MIIPKKLGLISDPPALVLIYKVQNNNSEKFKRRKRKMPLRNFNDSTNILKYLEKILCPNHLEYLKEVPNEVLQKFLRIIQIVQKGKSIEEAVAKSDQEFNANSITSEIPDGTEGDSTSFQDQGQGQTVTASNPIPSIISPGISDEKHEEPKSFEDEEEISNEKHEEPKSLEDEENNDDGRENDDDEFDEEEMEAGKSRASLYEKTSASSSEDEVDDKSISVSFVASASNKKDNEKAEKEEILEVTSNQNEMDSFFSLAPAFDRKKFGIGLNENSKTFTPDESEHEENKITVLANKDDDNDIEENLSLFDLIKKEESKKNTPLNRKGSNITLSSNTTDFFGLGPISNSSILPKFTEIGPNQGNSLEQAEDDMDKRAGRSEDSKPTSVSLFSEEKAQTNKKLEGQLNNIFSFNKRKPFLSTTFNSVTEDNQESDNDNNNNTGAESDEDRILSSVKENPDDKNEGNTDDEDKDNLDNPDGVVEENPANAEEDKSESEVEHFIPTTSTTSLFSKTKPQAQTETNVLPVPIPSLEISINEEKIETSNEVINAADDDDDFFW